MPDRITRVAAIGGSQFDEPIEAADVRVLGSGAQASVRVSNYGWGESTVLAPLSNGDFRATNTASISNSNRVSIQMSDRVGASLEQLAINDAFDIWDAGGRSSIAVHLSANGFYGDRAELLATRIGSTDIVFVARAGGSGVHSFERNANGSLSAVDSEMNTDTNYLRDVGALAMVDLGGGDRYLFTGSGSENGISVLDISSSGYLTQVGHLGERQGMPIQSVSALDVVSIGGKDFLIAAGAGTSSLTVMEIDSNGTLSVVDHVLDGRDTRFGGVTEMATLTVGDHVFVAVTGSDRGLTLLTLTEDGELIHLDTIADQTNTALRGVSALAMVETSRGLEIITTSGSEAGVNQFRVDLEPFQLSGSAADEIIEDSNGTQTLSGGAGADIFVLLSDGDHDVITGLIAGVDTVDLSRWSQFYGAEQLDIAERNWGARIAYKGETLDLRSADGDSFSIADVNALVSARLSRIDVSAPSSMFFPERIVEGSNTGDMLRGSADSDTISSSSGDDSLFGLAGDDNIFGGKGNDVLSGGTGNDSLTDHSGADFFIGGAGNDTVSYAGHASGVMVNLETGENSSGDRFESIENLHGSLERADFLIGDKGDNKLRGLGGNDTLYGGAGDDRLYGGPGNDYLHDAAGSDVFFGSAGSDTVSYEDRTGSVLVDLETGENTSGDIYSSIENVRGSGRGNDTLFGTSGNNHIHGSGGDDLIYGRRGNDRLEGGAGNDRFVDISGADTFNGGDGRDTVSYHSSSVSIRVNLRTGENSRSDDFISIEGINGSNIAGDVLKGDDKENRLQGFGGDDTLSGSTGNDTLDGGNGDDYLFDNSGRDWFLGGSGRDTVSYYSRSKGIMVNLETGENNSGDRYSSIEVLRGSNKGDDTLIGDSANNRLEGNGGDDTVIGGRGDDTLIGSSGDDYLRDDYGADVFHGGSGSDTVGYYGREGGVEVDLGTGENSSGDRYISIENARGSNRGADTLTGSDGNNRLDGVGGNDSLTGGRGNDTLNGGSGDDFLRDLSGRDRFIGGSGQDTVSYVGRSTPIIIDLSTGKNNSGDYFSGIEHLFGTTGSRDRLEGDSADNYLRGYGGSDTLVGNAGDDSLIGDSGNDYLSDASGRNYFSGGSGRDTVSYYSKRSGVEVDLRDGSNNSGDRYRSIEALKGSNRGDDTLIGNDEENVLKGSGGNDRLNGMGGNDILEGGSGNDYLRDDEGKDVFRGGSGNDTVSYVGHSGAVNINLATKENNSGDRYSSIESVLGTRQGDDTLRGSDKDNFLSGDGGDDRLYGGSGNDTLSGGDGDDYLRDTSGRDVFNGGAGQDTVVFYSRRDGVELDLSTGRNNGGDQFSGIEHVRGSNTGSDRLTGDANGNELLGYGGNDRLSGGGGNDTLIGGSGRDTLDGGSGSDRLVATTGAETFIGGSGQDTVSYYDLSAGITVNLRTGYNSSSDSYSSIEHLWGSNSRGDRLTGNSGDNKLWGFGGWDTIKGGDGDDKLIGGAGNDRLTGGSGKDEFIFRKSDRNDVINDFEIGEDLIRFDIAGLDYSDLVFADTSAGAKVSTGEGTTVTLADIEVSDLGSSDFDFT